jgi:hypothetical protein
MKALYAAIKAIPLALLENALYAVDSNSGQPNPQYDEVRLLRSAIRRFLENTKQFIK